MKILFVYTDINVRGGAQSYQFGIGMLSAMLKKHGHNTKLHYMFGNCRTDLLKDKIANYHPDIIAFSAVSPQYQYVKQIFNDIKQFDAFTILGGTHATLAPECIQEVPALNAICIGEGEIPLLELVEALKEGTSIDNIRSLWIKKPNGSIIRNPTRPFEGSLDNLPFPDREIFDFQSIIDSDFNTALFMFSRGCPYKCTFCSNHAIREKQEGTYVRFRSAESCIKEIREVISHYKVQTLYFNDDCFTVKQSFVNEFCSAYKENFSLPFDINARPETLSDEICSTLKNAGCRRISIGIENGSEKFRREVLGRKQTNERIIQAFESCHKAGLKTKSFNIVGFPHETPEIFQETINLNARINPDSVIIGIFEPYPGTQLADISETEHFIDTSRKGKSFIGRTDTVLDMPNFSRKDILCCFRNFAYNVYKQHSLRKAIFLRIYYSRYGELLLRITAPLKNIIRKLTMGV